MGFSLKKIAGPVLAALNPVGLIGTAIGGAEAGLNYLGEKEARRADLASAREQMSFQERMSSTSHQREVADLKAAGLNPVLSANSGASTPAGQTIDAESMFKGVGPAIGSALEAARLKAELKESASRARKNNVDADVAETYIPLERKKQGVLNKIWDFFSGSINNSAKDVNTYKSGSPEDKVRKFLNFPDRGSSFHSDYEYRKSRKLDVGR